MRVDTYYIDVTLNITIVIMYSAKNTNGRSVILRNWFNKTKTKINKQKSSILSWKVVK